MADISLVEKLLSKEPEEMKKKYRAQVVCRHLSRVLGAETAVTVGALNCRRFMDIAKMSYDSRNRLDYDRLVDMNLQLVLAGVVEPDLKNKELMEHFGCATPKDLAELLFPGGDLTALAAAITEISGFGEQVEDDLKN